MVTIGEDGRVELSDAINAAPLSTFQIRVAGLCSFGALLDGYDMQAMGLAVPSVAQDLAVQPGALGPALAAGLVGMAIGALLLGTLADRFGRRPMMIALMLLVGAASLATAASGDLWQLAFWRLVTGLGLGGMVPVATSLTAEYAPKRRRTAMVTLMICCISLGSVFASVIAPAIDARHGWRGIFVFGGILPIATALLYWFVLPESLRFLMRANAASARVAYQLNRIVPVIAPESVYVATVEAAYGQPVRALLSRRYMARNLLLWSIWGLNLFVNFSLSSWLPTLLASAGWSHATAMHAIGFMAMGGLLGGLCLSWLADYRYIVGPLIAAYLIAIGALLGFGFLPADKWGMLVALAGLGAFGGQLTIGSLAVAFYPSDIRATGLGWAGGIGRLGSIAGPLILGVMIGQGLSTPTILGLLAVPLGICALCTLLVPRFAHAA
ncbi:MAG: MFS transporter [Sphingobium sp.]